MRSVAFVIVRYYSCSMLLGAAVCERCERVCECLYEHICVSKEIRVHFLDHVGVTNGYLYE